MDEKSLQYIDHEVNAWMSIEAMIKMKIDRARTHRGSPSCSFKVELTDGRVASLWKCQAVLQHRQPDLGIGFNHDPRTWDLLGTAIRFTENGPMATRGGYGLYDQKVLYEDDAIEYDYDDEESLITQSMGFLPMRRKVYNIEVENTHTYYVGNPGVWVHNTCNIVEHKYRPYI